MNDNGVVALDSPQLLEDYIEEKKIPRKKEEKKEEKMEVEENEKKEEQKMEVEPEFEIQ